MFFQTIFILLQLTLISQAQFSTYDVDYEEVNLLIRVEDWNAGDAPYSTFTFEAGEKLFGSNFLWNINAAKYNVEGVAAVMIHDTREQEYPDRFIQSNTKVLSCDGEVDSGLDDTGYISHNYVVANGFLNTDVDAFVCPNDWVRFTVQFRIYKNSSFIFGEEGFIANEVPFEITRKTLANSSIIDEQFTAGKDYWDKSVTWRLVNSDFPLFDYEFELVASDFDGARAFGGGTLEIEIEITGRPTEIYTYVFYVKEYKVGTKIPFKLQNLANEKYYVTRVELDWQTFGLGARLSDYIVYDPFMPRNTDLKSLLSNVRKIIKN